MSNQNESNMLFKYGTDHYGNVVVDVGSQKSLKDFSEMLNNSIKKWKEEDFPGVWVTLPLKYAGYAMKLVENGFKFHHIGNDESFVFMKWLSNSPCVIPEYARSMIGCCGLTVNWDKEEILIVYERHGPPKWKLPGGTLTDNENIGNVAEREVKEETGVVASFQTLIGFRYLHNARWRTIDDIYFVCVLSAKKTDIKIDKTELKDAKWISFKEWFNMDLSKVTNVDSYIRDSFKKWLENGLHPITKAKDSSWKRGTRSYESEYYSLV